ncbi:MAG: hypothetical protein K0R18_1258 [Bacillales bacterium]|nr:hypothetical protein [Bacillales bacterium]
MNIVQRKKAMAEVIDTIKTSIFMFNGHIIREYNYTSWGQYLIEFKFDDWSRMIIQFDLYSNFIVTSTFCNKYEAFHLKKLYNKINATPKEIFINSPFSGTKNIYHNFKISKANIERLYDIFIVMARF